MELTQLDTWKALERQALNLLSFKKEPNTKILSGSNITIDYTPQRLNTTIHHLLLKLATECDLEKKIDALFSGDLVNKTEKKPALHTALRASPKEEVWINKSNVMPQVLAVKEQMRIISEQIRAGKWQGYSNKPITDIVNIGIGGSQLGPLFCMHALVEEASCLSFHFVSDIDPMAFKKITTGLNPETTLFIICSKSFTTIESLYNLKKAFSWIGSRDGAHKHFIAVTANIEQAKSYGLTHILSIWDWVGGRFSLCSAINLITCIAIGFEKFLELLEGAREMDNHFRSTPFAYNLPVNLALFGIWNNNFLKIHHLLLLTYGYQLDYFASYVQQLDMESNGKSIDITGKAVNYATAPIVWGGSGTQAQHSYYQLLCQGTHRVVADLISVDSMQDVPVSNLCLAQKEVLSNGTQDMDNPDDYIPGHIPLNHIRLRNNSPRSIGSLIALYEHKIYVQSIIWRINAFDQPGVESSKKIMRKSLIHA